MHVFKHPSFYKKLKEEGKRSSNKQQAQATSSEDTSSKDPEATSSKQSTRLKPQATSIKP